MIGVGGTGPVAEINLLAVMRSAPASTAPRCSPTARAEAAARLKEKEVLPHFADGTLTVPVAATFPLAEAEQAYDRFAAGGKLGKLVLLPGPSSRANSGGSASRRAAAGSGAFAIIIAASVIAPSRGARAVGPRARGTARAPSRFWSAGITTPRA